MSEEPYSYIGKSVPRKDIWDKVTGRAKYIADTTMPGMLHAKLHTSSQAHALIRSVDTTEAEKAPGVRAIVTSAVYSKPVGPLLADRPPLAVNKVRYFGEPVAIVVADEPWQAAHAASLIRVEYDPLPIVHSPGDGLKSGAPLVHDHMHYQPQTENIVPMPGTNVANHTKIRKGNMEAGWADSDETAEVTVSFPPTDHVAIETRCAKAEIMSDQRVIIHSASQAPFYIKQLLCAFFDVQPGQLTVVTPLVGGAFGGKGSVQLELLAFMASHAVGGLLVCIENSREEDLVTSPVHIGMEAQVKLGATKDGKIMAAQYRFAFDGGAYSDQGAGISKAAACDCTGPYHIDNVWCDSYCVYTNHTYATSFRGYGHPELTFAMERAMDKLAAKLLMDPVELRLKNAIKPLNSTPTQTTLNTSNVGDLTACLTKVTQMIRWDDGQVKRTEQGKVVAKGISCLWKTSSTATNAGAGAILTFNQDGSINLHTAAVELGQGSKTVLAQIAAEKFRMDFDKIHIVLETDTRFDPHQWKTVASSTTILAGRAVMAAADDAIAQLKQMGAIALKCSAEDLDIAWGNVFLRDSPEFHVLIKDIAFGYKYPNGNSIGGDIIGRGSHIARHLSTLDEQTGSGKPGPQWTVGAQAVEVEFDPIDHSYRILKAATVLDAGKVLHPQAAIGQMRGGMSMGLSFATSEEFMYDDSAVVVNPQLRNYKIMRFGEQPEYLVDFVETPLIDGPYGARGIGEYGVIGMPAALATALSAAAGVELYQLPLTPELIWSRCKEAAQ
jgi:CO/xanthine dehydrogenase Mo-binding subunit